MKFSEMKYTRPDLEEIKGRAAEIKNSFENAPDFDSADRAFTEWDSFTSHIDTMMSLAYTRHTINTEDEYYEAEVEYIDEISPEFTDICQGFTKLLTNSKYKEQFAEKYGSLMFKNAEIFLKAFSPEIIPETQQLNKLETEYQKLLASAQINFDGEKRTIAQMYPYKMSAEDNIRTAAWRAEGEFYNKNGAQLDQIYDKMVRLRDEAAKKLGYKSFVKLGYLQMNRNCFTPEDIKKFRSAVVKYIVPLAQKLYKNQAKRTGLDYPFTYADAALRFRDGNPKPQGTAEDIIATGRKLYHSLSEESGRFYDMMLDSELMDLLSKKGKAGGGYCTQLLDYKVPFIFANFNGTADDVETVTHEAGHAFAYYVARDIHPTDNQSPTLDACEIHSMTMEFFGWRCSDEFFGKDSQKFRYNHLFSAITFIPYGCMVDHFQHIVYENPAMTPLQRHNLWKELMGVYMPWIRLDGSPFYGEGKAWQRQIHIYENPFYYIDYCLAQTVALEFFEIMQRDEKQAWDRYMTLVRGAGTKTFDELVESAGLSSPFDENTLKQTAEFCEEMLRGIYSA